MNSPLFVDFRDRSAVCVVTMMATDRTTLPLEIKRQWWTHWTLETAGRTTPPALTLWPANRPVPPTPTDKLGL